MINLMCTQFFERAEIKGMLIERHFGSQGDERVINRQKVIRTDL